MASITQNSFHDFITKKRNVQTAKHEKKHVVEHENTILRFFLPEKRRDTDRHKEKGVKDGKVTLV